MKNSTDSNLYFVLSLPRSGSTVLTAELDRFEGVVCLPESYFPFLIALIDNSKIKSKEQWAELFLAGCDAGFTLTKEELENVIQPEDWTLTLFEIGKMCAQKAGRCRDSVKAVVWKSTRNLSGYQVAKSTGARFIILRRNPINVFDSQFRVSFGIHNRNPLRFAAFRLSYEWVFSKFYQDSTFNLEYESIPHEMPGLLKWMNVPAVQRLDGRSTMADSVAKCEWHKGLLDGFNSNDTVKRRNVRLHSRALIWIFTLLLWPIKFYLGRLRRNYDIKLAKKIALRAGIIV